MYKLVKTERFRIGDVEVSPTSYRMAKSLYRPSTLLLFDQDNFEPVFEVNAYLLSHAAKERCTDQRSKALLKYFNFLAVNPQLSWNDYAHCSSDNYPPILFRNKLKQHKDLGNIADTTANAYMGYIKEFYLFCYRHGYIDREFGLPFTLETSMYGKHTSNLRIKTYNRNKNLKPISHHHLSMIIMFWSAICIEIRLAILITLFTGMRNKEVISIPKDILSIPDGFKGVNITGITISPNLSVNTKLGIERQISCPVWLAELLEQYHNSERYRIRCKKYYEEIGELDFPALINRIGKPYTTQDLTQQWCNLSREIRKKGDINFRHKYYDLRATFGVAKVESLSKVNKISFHQIRAILQQEMGHTKSTTTDLYLEHWELNPAIVQHTAMMEDLVSEALKQGVLD